jgi:hypothetical protein
VAKYLGVFWEAKIGDPDADDVGPLQVRTNTSRRLDDMILRPGDKRARIYISVLSFTPEFILCGWIWGNDGMRQEWLRNGSPDRPPCFFVPRSALKPLETIPKEMILNTAA